MSTSPAFLGQITMFAGHYAPAGWAFCNGQTLSIRNYMALFSLLGTTYGGDGHRTFCLPDLRGRVPIHAGQGVGLTEKILGSKGGAEVYPTVTVDVKNAEAGGEPRKVLAESPSYPPYQVVNYLIAVDVGVYPPRN